MCNLLIKKIYELMGVVIYIYIYIYIFEWYTYGKAQKDRIRMKKFA